MHAVGYQRHRPGGGQPGGRRAVQPVGVFRGGSGRKRVADRRAGGQHDGRRDDDAGKVGEQQSGRDRPADQETVSKHGLRARRLMRDDSPQPPPTTTPS